MERSLFVFEPSQKVFDGIRGFDFDSVFFGYHGFSKENADQVKEINSGAQINVEVPVFAGKELLEKYPDAKPVEYQNNPTEKDWYAGVCPTHEGVRQEALNKVKELLEHDINGIWLDFIRYPTKWEEVEPLIMDTCYCDRCLKKFSEYIDEPIEGADLEEKYLLIDGAFYYEWLEFKTDQISSMVKEVRDLITGSQKEIKLGAFIVPWKDDDHGQAIKRIVAQEFSKIFPDLDIFSPMLYHKMTGNEVEWIKEMVEYYWETGKPFLPLIQTEDKPDKLGDEDFKRSLEYAVESPSEGVCVFFVDYILDQPGKVKILKDFFSSNS